MASGAPTFDMCMCVPGQRLAMQNRKGKDNGFLRFYKQVGNGNYLNCFLTGSFKWLPSIMGNNVYECNTVVGNLVCKLLQEKQAMYMV